MLKRYVNKIPLLLGGLLLATLSNQAVAVTGCGTLTYGNNIYFTSLDPKIPLGDKNSNENGTTVGEQYISANSYLGEIQVTIKSDSTDVSRCGWSLKGSKYVTNLPSGKLYGNQTFTYHVPFNPSLTTDRSPDRTHEIMLAFDDDSNLHREFTIKQAPLDPHPTVPTGCETGKTFRSGLCYTDCKSGYSSDGATMCYQNCPDGWSATTTSCTKKTYTRSVGTLPKYATDCSGSWTTLKCKTTSSCPGDKRNEDGLCYDKPKSGYACTALPCWQSCPSGMTDFGVGCTKGSYSVGTGVEPNCPSERFPYGKLCYRKSYKVDWDGNYGNW